MLSDINISHGSVATPIRCGGICNDGFIVNFLLSAAVEEFWKSVIIWQSYGQEFGVLFFIGPRCRLEMYAVKKYRGIVNNGIIHRELMKSLHERRSLRKKAF